MDDDAVADAGMVWGDYALAGVEDSAGEADVPPPPPAGPAESRRSVRRAQRWAGRKSEKKDAHSKEMIALHGVLESLSAALPVLTPVPAPPSVEDWVPQDGPADRPKRRTGPSDWEAYESQVESSLSVVEAALVSELPYRQLPEAFGPEEGLDIVASMLERPPKYQAKFAPQEVSLISKVWALAGGSGEGLAVIDIGAGNGCLAFLAAVVLKCHAVLLDRELPPETLQVERKVPEKYRGQILRITGDVGDPDVRRDLESLLRRHGVTRAIVVAKHLCGVGTDLAMGLLSMWRQGQVDGAESAEDSSGHGSEIPELLGAVFATCCGHKIAAADRETYASLHEGDEYLGRLTGSDPACLRQLLSASTRCVAWRTTSGAASNRITAMQIRAAELFEDLLQQPRLNELRRSFSAAEEVIFVSAARSPQNRCLIGARTPEALITARDPGDSFVAALADARDELAVVVGGPLDLKPRGFVSSRFDYDGT